MINLSVQVYAHAATPPPFFSWARYVSEKLGCFFPHRLSVEEKKKLSHEQAKQTLIKCKTKHSGQMSGVALTLRECIEVAEKHRCLPNRVESNNPVSLLRFLSEKQLNTALGQPADINPLQTLKKMHPKGSKQRELLSYLSAEPNARELCQQALLEREASRLPDAFFTHCQDLVASLSCLAASESGYNTLGAVIHLRNTLGAPESWKDALTELILAPSVKPETVQFFLSLFDRILPQFVAENNLSPPDSLPQLVTAIQKNAGPEKINLATSTGLGESFAAVVGEVPSTLANFVRDSIRYNYSEDEKSNYDLLTALFYPETQTHPDAWIAGTYLYLTGRARNTLSVALPQLSLHNMISDSMASLSRNLLCCTLAATFMQRFSGADFTAVLKRLSELNTAFTNASELLAVPSCSTFVACAHLFRFADEGRCDELWTYTNASKPWNSTVSSVTMSSGPFGTVKSHIELAKELGFSDYSMHFEWGGIRPLQHTVDEALAQSPILHHLWEKSQSDQILSDRLKNALNALSLDLPPPPPSTSEPSSGFDTTLDGWDDTDAGEVIDL